MRLLVRFFAIVVLLAFVAGVGFWLRPVSYFNGEIYASEYLAGVRGRTVEVSGYRVHYNVGGRRVDRLSC